MMRKTATDSFKGLEDGNLREIYLLRHGQYDRSKGDHGELTALGRRQADRAAARLKRLRFDRMVHSSLPRAAETATRVQKILKLKSFKSSTGLWEVLPPVVKEFDELYPDSKRDAHFRKRQGAYAEKAFREVFRKPARKNSRELYVIHGNLMRFMLLRALKLDPRMWPYFDVKQCALAVFALDRNGRVKVISFNDYGHIPEKMQTYL